MSDFNEASRLSSELVFGRTLPRRRADTQAGAAGIRQRQLDDSRHGRGREPRGMGERGQYDPPPAQSGLPPEGVRMINQLIKRWLGVEAMEEELSRLRTWRTAAP
jgi:hypothetical protein